MDAAPDLTLLSRRYGGAFPAIRALTTIDGLARLGHADAVMPEFGAGDLRPLVVTDDRVGTPIPADLITLSEYLRSIQR